MKRIILLLVGFAFIANNIYSQGIEFMYDLDKALAKAKVEDKMVFVDFYTSWCGPCKQLTKDVFPLEKVGTFYNSNFISCKVQCDDDGVGVKLGEKYSVSAYPTLMFLSNENEMVHSMAGAPTADGLIEFAKTALNPETNLLSLINEWDSGNRNKGFVIKYFKTLKEAYRREKASIDFVEYFNSLNDKGKTDKSTFELIGIVGINPFDPTFNYIEKNKEIYYDNVGKKVVDEFISNSYLWYLQGMVSRGSKNDFKVAMTKFRAKNYPYYDEFAMFYNVYETEDTNGKWDVDEYQRRGTEFLNKYGKNNDSYTLSLASLLGNLTGKPDQGVSGIKWMEDLLERNPDSKYMHTYFYLLHRNHHFDRAFEVGNEIRKNSIENGLSTDAIDKQMQQVKDYRDKLEKRKQTNK